MNEYISREAVRNALYEADAITMKGVAILNQFPAADVAPVRHGRWEQVEIIHVEDLKEEDKDCISIASITESVRYCSNCGSKMDGGQDDG